ncbi:MAG: hypothetical protein H6839_08865 [Planctomycetes bacterium]|nr:hypothetical protein [Planctomycetota bacterium]
MAKISIKPVDHGPAPAASAMFVKLAGLVVMTISLVGIIFMLLTYSWQDDRESWDWEPESIRTNFDPLLTTEQIRALFKQKREQWQTEHPINQLPGNFETDSDPTKANKPKSNDVGLPFDGGEELPPPDPFPSSGGTDQRDLARQEAERELAIAEKLTLEPVFRLADETQNLLDFVQFTDASREKSMNEFDAYRGRQAPTNEVLALQILKKLPAPGSAAYAEYQKRVEQSGWYFGKSQDVCEVYRGRGFAAEGRLFDLYEIRPDKAIVLQDGTKVESYYEGVVALLGPGMLRKEHKIEQRTVEFQALTIPDALKPYVNDKGSVSHEDKLVTEKVMVKFTGAFLRRWIYSREVKPYSTQAKKVVTQDHLPLLLTADLALSQRSPYELTDELLQQVRDAMREDPIYLESEAAYYAMLAKANDPDDQVEIVPEIGYFDLAGEETGPRYRGQGIHVVGMIGDDYAPVILPPNISGLRRVFRALVLHDTGDLETPKRYLCDMIEPPTGLEPRALIDIDARYYRNVFESNSTSSSVRPLIIVRKMKGIAEDSEEGAWLYAVAGIGGVVLLLAVLTWFILSERRERARFEASTLELSRGRIKKQGGLKLKPLPGGKGGEPEAPAEPTQPEQPSEPEPDDPHAKE